MTWLLLRTPSGTAIEHHALLGAALAVAICAVTGWR